MSYVKNLCFPEFLVLKCRRRVYPNRTLSHKEYKEFILSTHDIEVIHAGDCSLAACREYGKLEITELATGKVLLRLHPEGTEVLQACSYHQITGDRKRNEVRHVLSKHEQNKKS